MYYLHTMTANNWKRLLLLKFQLSLIKQYLITFLHFVVKNWFNEWMNISSLYNSIGVKHSKIHRAGKQNKTYEQTKKIINEC